MACFTWSSLDHGCRALSPEAYRTVLILEDCDGDAELAAELLRPHGFFVRRACSEAEVYAAEGRLVYVLDLGDLGDVSAALGRLRGRPVVVWTGGEVSEAQRLDLVHMGATWLLPKGEYEHLPAAVMAAALRAEAQEIA